MSPPPMWFYLLIIGVIVGVYILDCLYTFVFKKRAEHRRERGITRCKVDFRDKSSVILEVTYEEKEKFLLTHDLSSKSLQIGPNVFRTEDVTSVVWEDEV